MFCQKCIFRNVIFKSVYDWVTSADRGACGTFVCTFSPGGSISDLKTAISAARVVKCRNLSSHFSLIGFYKLGVLSDQSVFVILILHLRIQNQVITSNRSSSVYHGAPPEMQQYFHAAQSHNVVTNPAWAFSRPKVALFQSFWCCMGNLNGQSVASIAGDKLHVWSLWLLRIRGGRYRGSFTRFIDAPTHSRPLTGCCQNQNIKYRPLASPDDTW